jgi:hypothetical protein
MATNSLFVSEIIAGESTLFGSRQKDQLPRPRRSWISALAAAVCDNFQENQASRGLGGLGKAYSLHFREWSETVVFFCLKEP